MFIDPVTLIDQTLENLELLSELFADELDERIRDTRVANAGTRQCQEALNAINMLLPALSVATTKLQAARSTQLAQGLPPQRMCANCDDY
jgi:hypothetical protein